MALHELDAHDTHEGHLLAHIAPGEVAAHGIGIDEWDILAQERADVERRQQGGGATQGDDGRGIGLQGPEVARSPTPVLDMIGGFEAVGIASCGEVGGIVEVVAQLQV